MGGSDTYNNLNKHGTSVKFVTELCCSQHPCDITGGRQDQLEKENQALVKDCTTELKGPSLKSFKVLRNQGLMFDYPIPYLSGHNSV